MSFPTGHKLVSYVHFGENFLNAFWDGQHMVYGDGNALNNFNPLTTLDVGGHEITHGLINFSSNLVYQKESGALNESFADIFGNVIQHYSNPSQWKENDWLLGEDMEFPIRDMCNPKAFNDPDTYEGEHWAPLDGGDFGGVHTNSGVQNKWFCLMVNGGSGTNDNGDYYEVKGIGWEKAEKIAFENAVYRLTENSDYEDARNNAIAAAKDIYGECSMEHFTTAQAWYAVGVGDPIQCFVTGIHDNKNSIEMLTINPNPVVNEFRLDFKTNTQDNYQIEIRNILGEVIISKNLGYFKGNYSQTFDLNRYAKGMYTLSISGSKQKLVKKIIKK